MNDRDIELARSHFYEQLTPNALAPLWTVLGQLVTSEPHGLMEAHRWDYASVRNHLLRSGELISAEEAERRVLILENPAAPGNARITSTLYAGLQLILPGEVAPCHRHSQSALRFVLEGAGAYTAVDGERAEMGPFDLVLTPNGRWHDHANPSKKPMVWLDGLDIPLVSAFDTSFAERLDGKLQYPQETKSGSCQALWGANLRPADIEPNKPDHIAPLFHYPFSCWRPALERFAEVAEVDDWNGFRMEFVDPTSGGPIMPTMSAFCQKLPQGFTTRPQRTTDGRIFVGVEGAGEIRVDGEAFPIGERDIVVVPGWAEHAITAQSDLILFSYSDEAAQRALRLWKERKL